MLSFHELTLADRPWVQHALEQSQFMGCEYSFANNLAWRRAADSRIARLDDFYLICAFDTEDGAPHFTFPAGSGDLARAVRAMAEVAVALHQPLVIGGLTAQTLPRLEACFPGCFTLENQRDSADYLYDTREFIALSGKKYHKKRNHIAQFAKYGAVFSEMTPADFDECIAFAANSYNQRDGYTDASSVAEQFAIHTFFTNFAALGLKGGVLRIAGKLAAFSIGEPISRGVFGVHIEKADIQYHGAYPAMAQQFAAHFAQDYAYLNREEDLGIPGLRKSKLSYHPALLLEKWTATCRTPEQFL